MKELTLKSKKKGKAGYCTSKDLSSFVLGTVNG